MEDLKLLLQMLVTIILIGVIFMLVLSVVGSSDDF
jgi:hypothetical protein